MWALGRCLDRRRALARGTGSYGRSRQELAYFDASWCSCAGCRGGPSSRPVARCARGSTKLHVRRRPEVPAAMIERRRGSTPLSAIDPVVRGVGGGGRSDAVTHLGPVAAYTFPAMQITRTPAPKSAIQLEIELPPERLDRALDTAARALSRRTRVPGFRPGKAPRPVLERHLGPGAVLDEAVEHLVQDAYREAIVSEEIQPLANADVEVVQAEE